MILSLSTIATGTPLLVPLFSASFKTVREYLPDLDPNDISVDMKSSHSQLCDKIKMVVLHYPAYQKRALEMRGILKAKTNEVSRRMKTELIELICRHEDITLDSPSDVAVVAQGHTTETNVSPKSDIYKTEPAAKRRRIGNDNTTQGCDFEVDNVEVTSQADPVNDDKNGKSSQVDVRLQVQGGAPENDKQMGDVENDFFRHESTQANAQVYRSKITNIHPELQGEDIGKGSLNFTIGCGSQDAADALWDAYSSGRLDRMADETFLSIPLLNDIGVRMLSLETFIDYQKYLQCKQDITDREAATKAPDVNVLHNQNEDLKSYANQSRDNARMKKQELMEKQSQRDGLKSMFVDESKAFEAAESRMLEKQLSMKARHRETGQKLRKKRDELRLEQASITENMDMQRNKLTDQLDEVNREIAALPERNFVRTNELLNKISELNRELFDMEDSNETEKKRLRAQISEVNAELDSSGNDYDKEMMQLTELQQKLPEEISIITKRIKEAKEMDQLISSLIRIKQGLYILKQLRNPVFDRMYMKEAV
ncbi:putative leucine-rich repeat-containing protein DDB_G0290503 [Ptychodera flava]|uniref:putative leucine-rich repeat-containing protein DDB_G0290503 n=1 Tax=Ptychodera flava TaxID=63121 RepID=UPI00396AB0A0